MSTETDDDDRFPFGLLLAWGLIIAAFFAGYFIGRA